MAAKDPAWTIFKEELGQGMSRPDAPTNAALATRLQVSEETVKNWRRGQSRPPLGLLTTISEVLKLGADDTGQRDPLYLLRRMGLLSEEPPPSELIDTAYRLQNLKQKLAEATDKAGALGRREGASIVVRAATGSGEWAVGVWPAVEGPPDCRLHVADRIDIRPADSRRSTTDQEVWQEPKLRAALRAAHAVPASGRTPRWSDRQTGVRPPGKAEPGVSRWAISHVGSPRSPQVRMPHPGVVSVVCVALTIESWVNDVASLLATALGYGLTTTRDLAMETYGLHDGGTRAEHRRVAYDTKLARPPEARVFSHHAPLPIPPTSPFWLHGMPWPSNVVFVWLREHDEVLRHWCTRRTADATFEKLIDDRDCIDDYARQIPEPSRIITVDVEPTAYFTTGDSTPRWTQVLQTVSTVLTEMTDRGFLTADLTAVHEKARIADPAVAVPLLRWLTNDGCAAMPAATQPRSTRRSR